MKLGSLFAGKVRLRELQRRRFTHWLDLSGQDFATSNVSVALLEEEGGAIRLRIEITNAEEFKNSDLLPPLLERIGATILSELSWHTDDWS